MSSSSERIEHARSLIDQATEELSPLKLPHYPEVDLMAARAKLETALHRLRVPSRRKPMTLAAAAR